MGELKRTDLHDLHVALGARMVAFAGYEMPVQYPAGVMKEHLHTRAAAGLFDVGHMGQVILRARDGTEAAAHALETLVPADIAGLAPGRQRYALFTNDAGGILDDMMVARREDHLFLVVNAARKDDDLAHLKDRLGGTIEVEPVADRGLLALQGPQAEAVLAPLVPGVAELRFMDAGAFETDFGDLWISRSGYTGEDGFEMSVPSSRTEDLARRLLEVPDVEPIGLGARDSLRLEAGLCLYGADLDETTSPVEAALGWSIGAARRAGGARAGGFPGAGRILAEMDEGPARRRVGLLPEGRAPMRAGVRIFAENSDSPVGEVTSGSFGPSVGGPVAMAYVTAGCAAPGTRLLGEVRGRMMPVTVAKMPFHPHAYRK